jgi:hypothetical protein
MKWENRPEHPIPEMIAMFSGFSCSCDSACVKPARSPKSPQPGHQTGSTLLL